jgi:methylenetetrahydrofolate/methylenetetrahydromethanopterin dehydrogenase (NADP+)
MCQAIHTSDLMDKPSILVQLDTDAQPSVFDRVVAVDAGAHHIFSYGGITPENAKPLVQGCIFTRGAKDLHRTAVFVGGSDLAAGEAVFSEVRKHLLPMFKLSVSVMLDSNGSNTTAAAAVVAASRHIDLKKCRSLVLGGTGPVGQRVARLLASLGGHVRIGSRSVQKANDAIDTIKRDVPKAKLEAVAASSDSDAADALDKVQLVIAAGAGGITLLPQRQRLAAKHLQVAIDLNGEPPAGIEGIELNDKAKNRDDCLCYGALGVGTTKMKIHKAALAAMFTQSDLVYDVEAIFKLAQSIEQSV